MIIGVSGYINSGKDTVGKIIQYLDSGSKVSFEEWCKPKYYSDSHISGFDIDGLSMYQCEDRWEIQKFAAKVKVIAGLLLNVDVEKFEDRKFKDTKLGPEWDNMTVRVFMQKLGTDAMRYGLHPDVWVNALMSEYKAGPHSGVTRDLRYPDWIITDVRFPNEARAIKDRGGFIIRINRYPPGVSPKLMDLHESETALDEWEFDHVVWNNGTIEDLTNQIKEILKINKVNLAES